MPEHAALAVGDGGVAVRIHASGLNGCARRDIAHVAQEVLDGKRGGRELFFHTVDGHRDGLGGADCDGLAGSEDVIRVGGDEVIRADLHAGGLEGALDVGGERRELRGLTVDVNGDVLVRGGRDDAADGEGAQHAAGGQTQRHGASVVNTLDLIRGRHVSLFVSFIVSSEPHLGPAAAWESNGTAGAAARATYDAQANDE